MTRMYSGPSPLEAGGHQAGDVLWRSLELHSLGRARGGEGLIGPSWDHVLLGKFRVLCLWEVFPELASLGLISVDCGRFHLGGSEWTQGGDMSSASLGVSSRCR